MRAFEPLAIVALLLLTACDASPAAVEDPADDPVDDRDDPTGGHVDDPPVTVGVRSLGAWEPCAWVPGSGDTLAECTIAVLPLDHEDTESPDFPVLVKRRPATGVEATQYWVVHGGPGDSAVDDADALSAGIVGTRPDLAIYAVDHRGIGGSHRLSCSAESKASAEGSAVTDAEWNACREELRGDGTLAYLSTTQSAHDIAALVDALRAEGTRVFVYGGSYGTYVAQRYLTLRPDQPTGVILEGIASPVEPLSDYDATVDRIAQRLFDVCARTASCQSHFLAHPWSVAESLIARFDAGHCTSAGVSSDDLRPLFATMATYDELRTILPAMVARLDRCSAVDVSRFHSLTTILGALSTEKANGGSGASTLLGIHVALSELYTASRSAADQRAELRTLTVASGIEPVLAAFAEQGFPTYPRDPHVGTWATYGGPLLMLHGGLDPVASVDRARAYRDRFTAPHQAFVEFPEGAHQLRGRTPTDAGDCATRLLGDFVDAPESTLDVSCVDDVPPLSFEGDPALNLALLGTSDAWND